MRPTSVVLHSPSGFQDMEFSLRHGNNKNRYLIRTMLGIDAEQLFPKFYGKGQETGYKFYEYTMKSREIILRVMLNPNYRTNETVSDLRDNVYRLVASNRTGLTEIQFKAAGTLHATIMGMITKVEVAYFTNTPELQITINCPDPIFRSPVPITYDPSELPGLNPIVVSDGASTAPHGFKLRLGFTANLPSLSIQDTLVDADWTFTVTPSGGFLSGDELVMSTEYAQKELYIIRSGVTTHLMDKLSTTSVWPQIFPGSNKFYFIGIAFFDWLEWSYRAAYWGL